jgi:hypothetical protein
MQDIMGNSHPLSTKQSTHMFKGIHTRSSLRQICMVSTEAVFIRLMVKPSKRKPLSSNLILSTQHAVSFTVTKFCIGEAAVKKLTP